MADFNTTTTLPKSNWSIATITGIADEKRVSAGKPFALPSGQYNFHDEAISQTVRQLSPQAGQNFYQCQKSTDTLVMGPTQADLRKSVARHSANLIDSVTDQLTDILNKPKAEREKVINLSQDISNFAWACNLMTYAEQKNAAGQYLHQNERETLEGAQLTHDIDKITAELTQRKDTSSDAYKAKYNQYNILIRTRLVRVLHQVNQAKENDLADNGPLTQSLKRYSEVVKKLKNQGTAIVVAANNEHHAYLTPRDETNYLTLNVLQQTNSNLFISGASGSTSPSCHTLFSYSNRSNPTDVAPGSHIKVTDPATGQSELEYGTCFSAAYESAVILNMMKANPDLSINQIRKIFDETNYKPSPLTEGMGSGFIQQKQAVDRAKSMGGGK